MQGDVSATVREWMTDVHKSMAKSVVALGFPNGGKNTAPAERNISIPLGAKLLEAGYAIYAEPTLSGDSIASRVDLIAANSANAFAIEIKRRVKRFGKVLEDVDRIKKFRVQTARLAGGARGDSSFMGARKTWGLFVATNFEEDSGVFASKWRGIQTVDDTAARWKFEEQLVTALPQNAIFDCTDAIHTTEIFDNTGAFRLY